MTSNSRLEELKQQVRKTSNQQMHIQAQREQAEEMVAYHRQAQDKNQQEMTQLVRNVFGQSELAAAKERELLHDQLERFAHSQNVMNEQLIALNDNLTDMTSLKALYDAKREELETDHRIQKATLEKQIDALQREYASKQWELNTQYLKKQKEYDALIEEKKEEVRKLEYRANDINFWRIVRNALIAAAIAFVLAFAVFLGLRLAGILKITTTARIE